MLEGQSRALYVDFRLVYLKEKTKKLPLKLFSQAPITSSENLLTPHSLLTLSQMFKPESSRIF